MTNTPFRQIRNRATAFSPPLISYYLQHVVKVGSAISYYLPTKAFSAAARGLVGTAGGRLTKAFSAAPRVFGGTAGGVAREGLREHG